MAYHDDRKQPLQDSIDANKLTKKQLSSDSCGCMQKQSDDEACESYGSLFDAIGRDMTINCLVRCPRIDYKSIASVNRSFQALIKSGDVYRARREQGLTEHWLCFYRHMQKAKAFDPINKKWIHLPSMNECFFSDECFGVGSELLVFGEEIDSHDILVRKYNILTNSWSYGTSMNVSRRNFGFASHGAIAIVAGGCDCDCFGQILNSVEMYNSETQIWENLPGMNKPRKNCGVVFMDDKFCVIGGVNGLTCGEEFNLKTRVWTQIPDMLNGIPPLVAVVNNELYLADCVDMELKKYNKERNMWSTLGKLPREGFHGFISCGNRLIVLTGVGNYNYEKDFVEIYSWVPSEDSLNWNLLDVKQSCEIDLRYYTVMSLEC